MRRKKGMSWKENIYVYLQRSLDYCKFRLSPLHPLDRAVCSVALVLPPPSPLSFSFSPSIPSILRVGYLPPWRVSLRLIDFLRPDGVRGCDSNGCNFSPTLSLLSLLTPVQLRTLAWRFYHRLSVPTSAVISNFLLSSFENRDDEDEVNDCDRWAGGGVDRGAGSGGKRWWRREAWEAADGPRGKGMQDIAAPRDTRRRNLHDGAGDVLQSRSTPTTESLGFHVWMAHSPWLVSRKVYLFRLPPLLLRTPLAARLTRDEHRAACVFSHPFNLHGRVRGTKIPFFAGTRDQDDGTARRRNASCIADFFHYDS